MTCEEGTWNTDTPKCKGTVCKRTLICILRYIACSLGLGSALGEKGKKIGVAEKKKKKIGGRSELRGSLGRKKGGGAWRHAFDAADPPSSN